MMIQDRKKQFDMNIRTISNGMAIYSYINKNVKVFDASILLREQYAMVISAFDTYLHGIVEDCMVASIFDRTACDVCEFNINLPILKCVLDSEDDEMREAIVRNHIKERLSRYSFQSPNSVEYAFKYIGIKHGWKELGKRLAKKPEDIRNTLAICVRRRNKITHESDWNPAIMGYDPISLSDVELCIDFITQIVSAIDQMKI